jgi:hypothetical protein
METKEVKLNENDYATVADIGFTGIIEEVGVDYKAQRKNNVVTTDNNPPLYITFHDDGSVTYSY